MGGRCVFVERVVPGEDVVNLSEEASHHVEGVLRSRGGERVEVRDGKGNAWSGEIVEAGRGCVRVLLKERLDLVRESSLELTLALAFSRSEKMDQVVRQATELGVQRLVAFRAQRSQYGLSGSQAGKRLQRWSRIAREALCQCERLRVPELAVLSDVSEFVDWSQTWGGGDDLRLLAFEGERDEGVMGVWRSMPRCSRVLAVVGPEGGWTQTEVHRFLSAGFHAVRVGPRILRLETAAVAFVSLVQLLWGDLGV